jgi:hypothetical protein
VVETGQKFNRLQDALFAIGDKTGTIRIDAGRWRDCAAQIAGDVKFVAAVPGKTIFDGRLCARRRWCCAGVRRASRADLCQYAPSGRQWFGHPP